MTTKCTGKHFRTLNAKTNAIVLDGGKRRLGNTTQLGKLILAQALKFAQNAHRFANRYFGAFLGGAKFPHPRSPVVMRSDGHDLKSQFVREDTVDHAILGTKAGRSMASPCSSERLVMKSGDPAQSKWPRDCRDVLPLLASLEDLLRYRGTLPVNAPMLEDLPHAKLHRYH